MRGEHAKPLEKRKGFCLKSVVDFFAIPSAVRAAYWKESIAKNKISLSIVCIIIFLTESFNIIRVLFFSPSGLGTANNRRYFAMYCALLMIASLSLFLQYRLRKGSEAKQWSVQYITILLMFLWHIGINTYDLSHNPDSGTSIFVTALLGLAIFIQMPAVFSAACFGLGYAMFSILAGPILRTGEQVNLTITFLVALAVSFTSSRHAVVSLNQRRKIDETNAQLRLLLQKDPLTGLLNKKAAQACVEQHLVAVTPHSPAALFIIDLDNFKGVNDHYGHPCGDYVLVETAWKLRSVFPQAAGIGRIGGDEFLVLLTHVTDNESLLRAGQQLIHELSKVSWNNRKLGLGCSVGICRVNRPGIPYGQVYRGADRSLYEAKWQGKGCCRVRELPPLHEEEEDAKPVASMGRKPTILVVSDPKGRLE